MPGPRPYKSATRTETKAVERAAETFSEWRVNRPQMDHSTLGDYSGARFDTTGQKLRPNCFCPGPKDSDSSALDEPVLPYPPQKSR
jgi:hypothetical protein